MLKEFSSLDRPMRCPNQILAHARFVRETEGKTFDSGTSIMDVCIKALRNKSDRSSAHELILTICGIGYIRRE